MPTKSKTRQVTTAAKAALAEGKRAPAKGAKQKRGEQAFVADALAEHLPQAKQVLAEHAAAAARAVDVTIILPEAARAEPALAAESQAEDPALLRRQQMAAERFIALGHARNSFLDFVRLMMPHLESPDDVQCSRFEVKAHHRLIVEALEKVERGEIRRLCISLCPRHGKSELCSRMFPAWFMGRDPYRQVVLCGASAEFAESEFGRKIKNIIMSPMFAQVFPTASLDGGSKAVGNLVFREGGNITSIGKGAQILGRGANLLVIDDPYSGVEEASSPAERKKLWEWFTADAISRLMPNGAVVIIHQRFHEDDLIGRLTDRSHPDHDPEIAKLWTHIKIPAVLKKTELSNVLSVETRVETDPVITSQFGHEAIGALWPERFGLRFFAEIKRQNVKRWQSLYMGDPTPDDGGFFKKEWLTGYRPEELPTNLRKYCASDHAVSTKQNRDSTILMPIGVDEEDTVWVLPDLWWRQADAETVVEAMLQLMDRHRPLLWWAENGHISQAIGPFLRKRMQEEQVYCAIEEMTPVKDKQTRAQSIQGRMAMRKVRFPKFASWWGEFEAQLLKFPEATHDDAVDAIAWIGIGLTRQVAAAKPRVVREEPESGTLAWVKRASRWEAHRKRLTFHDGF